MALSDTEQKIVSDLQSRAATLTSSARAELAKGLSFFRRFAWAACGASAVAGILFDHAVLSKLI